MRSKTLIKGGWFTRWHFICLCLLGSFFDRIPSTHRACSSAAVARTFTCST
ncbi:hypothetical protein PF003_g27837 [Phytophthora fragariae]|nr:hypothetical protein PF003_g27837 [Phytophthora fragariae]